LDLQTILSVADLLGTILVIYFVLKQQENLVNTLSPFIKDIVMSILESNDKRWKETSGVMQKLIEERREQRRQEDSEHDDYPY
jgi:hypothetical protein